MTTSIVSLKMFEFIAVCREDLRTNRTAGASTVLFLWNHRIGRLLFLARRRYGVLVLPLYIFPKLLARFHAAVIGCSVPFSTKLGRRVRFQHGLSGIFISSMAVIGDDCTILHQVTIGSNIGAREAGPAAPTIGKRVLIGVGAKIIGGVTVGDRTTIGAQALVIEDVPAAARVRAPKAHILKECEA